MEQFQIRTIERLNRLAVATKQLAFAYSACHRMLPNYQYFSRNYGWGNEYCLIEGLDVIRNYLLEDIRQFDKHKLLSTIYANVPHSDKFDTPFCTYAQDSASAIYYALNSIPKVDVQELSWSLVVSRDTVDAFIQINEHLTYDEKLESKITSHWLMRREIEKQQFDLEVLANQPVVNEEVLLSLTNFNDGRSNIDVSKFGY